MHDARPWPGIRRRGPPGGGPRERRARPGLPVTGLGHPVLPRLEHEPAVPAWRTAQRPEARVATRVRALEAGWTVPVAPARLQGGARRRLVAEATTLGRDETDA